MDDDLHPGAEHGLTDLESLPQGVLYQVVSKIYNGIHGTFPTYMRDWAPEQLIDWFVCSYTFDPKTQRWTCTKITIH